VNFIKAYNDTIVREFYLNLKTSITNNMGPFFQCVFIRGVLFNLITKSISEIFNIPNSKDIKG
jgi:hypothetical protein